MRVLLLIALAGAAGAVGRYAVSQWVRAPFGTLAVNVIGCFLFGLLISRSDDWLPITAGFLGAFTTFSAFGHETAGYMQQGDWAPALGNIAANVVLGIAATFAGLALARGG